MTSSDTLPVHLGFIIDGNRRWAASRGLLPKDGHLAGYETLKTVLLDVLARGVEYASVYIFSTENWNRDKKQVEDLMKLFLRFLREDTHIFVENNVRVRVMGNRKRLSDKLVRAIDHTEEMTATLTGGQLLVCLNYGGQQEIAEAAAHLIAEGYSAEEVTPALIEQFLYSPDIPPCDMIVRTGGEQRISNFMLWRSAYSELMFIKKFWPDMTKRDVSRILNEYTSRSRRFGG
ncbi:MAG: polyprenyl diphosphate synthase [Candidatus Saccharimonas sp.]